MLLKGRSINSWAIPAQPKRFHDFILCTTQVQGYGQVNVALVVLCVFICAQLCIWPMHRFWWRFLFCCYVCSLFDFSFATATVITEAHSNTDLILINCKCVLFLCKLKCFKTKKNCLKSMCIKINVKIYHLLFCRIFVKKN